MSDGTSSSFGRSGPLRETPDIAKAMQSLLQSTYSTAHTFFVLCTGSHAPVKKPATPTFHHMTKQTRPKTYAHVQSRVGFN